MTVRARNRQGAEWLTAFHCGACFWLDGSVAVNGGQLGSRDTARVRNQLGGGRSKRGVASHHGAYESAHGHAGEIHGGGRGRKR